MVLANPNHFCHPSLAQRFQDPRLLPLLARWHFDSAAVGRNLDCWLYRLLYRNESSWVVLFRAYDELPQAQRHSISVTHKPHGIYLLQSIGSLFLSNSNTTCPVLTPNFFCMWIAYTAGHLLAAVHWLPVPPQQRHHLSCTYTKRVVYVNSITCRAFTCCSPSAPCSSTTATLPTLHVCSTQTACRALTWCSPSAPCASAIATRLSCTYTKLVVCVRSINCRALTWCSPSAPCSSATATLPTLHVCATQTACRALTWCSPSAPCSSATGTSWPHCKTV